MAYAKKDEHNGRYKTEKGDPQLADKLINVLLIQAHMDRPDLINPLLDWEGNIICGLPSYPKKHDAVWLFRWNLVGPEKLGWKGINKSVGQDPALLVKNEYVRDKLFSVSD